MTSLKLKNTLKIRFIDELRSLMTVGREDEELEPWNQSEQKQFLEKYDLEIERLVNLMIKTYTDDNESEDLEDPENDWIRDFLYDDPENRVNFTELILNKTRYLA